MAKTRDTNSRRGSASMKPGTVQGPATDAATPTGVKKTRKGRRIDVTGTLTKTSKPVANTKKNNSDDNDDDDDHANSKGKGERRRRSFIPEVTTHENLFDLPDPEQILRRARAPRRATNATGSRKPAAKPAPAPARRPSRQAPKLGKRTATDANLDADGQRSPVRQSVRRPSRPIKPLPCSAAHAEQESPTEARNEMAKFVASATADIAAAHEKAAKEKAEAEKKKAAEEEVEAAAEAERRKALVAERLRQREAEAKAAERKKAAEQRVAKKKAALEEAAVRRKADEKNEREEAFRVHEEVARLKAAEEKADAEQAARDEAATLKEAALNEAAARQKANADRERAVQQKAAARERTEHHEAFRVHEEVARLKAAEEKADGLKAAWEDIAEQEEADLKKATKVRIAAEKQAAKNEAVRKEAAAKAKAVQEQADTEEWAAQEKAAREAAAAQARFTEEKAAKEKAAEVKAAQKGEEQAKKAKAARDNNATPEATSKAKVAMETTTTKQMREAEEAAKAEKQRQAREKAEKNVKEQIIKEAAGYKRPGAKAKRPAPPPEPKTDSNETNKKQKVEEKPSCKRLDDDLRLATFKFDRQDLKAPKGPVKVGTPLELNTIFQALASVTEAINAVCVANKQQKLWGLFHPESMIDHNVLDHPVVLARHDALVPLDRSTARKSHFSLVVLVQTEIVQIHGRDFFAMHHYDSDPSLRSAFHNTIAKTATRSTILKTGWAGERADDVETILGQSENRTVCDRPAGQEWASGLHAVLNGWVCALSLMHEKDSIVAKPSFYEKAVDLVNFAVRGLVSSQMILDFFDCYSYTKPDVMPESVREKRTFRETINFEQFHKLDTYIMKLVGREPRRDVDAAMEKPEKPAKPSPIKPQFSSSNFSGPKSGDRIPTPLDAHFRGVEGPTSLPKFEPDMINTEDLAADIDYDSARSDDDDVGGLDLDIDDEEEEELKQEEAKKKCPVFDPFTGREITAEAKAAADATREASFAAARERPAREQRDRERRAARENSVELVDPDVDSLFNDDTDLNDIYSDEPEVTQPAPTSAPKEEVTSPTLHLPPRTPQFPPDLQPTVAENEEEEEDLYSTSPPRHQNLDPSKPAQQAPGPPPPTPHDPPVETNTNASAPLPGLSRRPHPTGQPEIIQTSPGTTHRTIFAPIVPSPPPQPDNQLYNKPAPPRPIAIPNPRGSFKVPSTPSSANTSNSSGSQPATATLETKQNGVGLGLADGPETASKPTETLGGFKAPNTPCSASTSNSSGPQLTTAKIQAEQSEEDTQTGTLSLDAHQLEILKLTTHSTATTAPILQPSHTQYRPAQATSGYAPETAAEAAARYQPTLEEEEEEAWQEGFGSHAPLDSELEAAMQTYDPLEPADAWEQGEFEQSGVAQNSVKEEVGNLGNWDGEDDEDDGNELWGRGGGVYA